MKKINVKKPFDENTLSKDVPTYSSFNFLKQGIFDGLLHQKISLKTLKQVKILVQTLQAFVEKDTIKKKIMYSTEKEQTVKSLNSIYNYFNQLTFLNQELTSEQQVKIKQCFKYLRNNLLNKDPFFYLYLFFILDSDSKISDQPQKSKVLLAA